MNVEQLYTGCLAQGAYYIESKGEVAIIDPLREVQPYIDLAESRNAKITHIFETHFHADFVSGHVTLSEKTGAPIIYGPKANPTFDCIIAKDNQEFKIGDITLRAIHTPGHTLESTTYLLLDVDGKEHAIFSGDTLFLGDVGRPDLAQKKNAFTQEDLAGMLFDSLRNKLMHLPDETIVYPGHGAGSSCGKNMSKETVGTLGEQKKTNYALRADMNKEEFIKEVTDGLLPPPAYFPMNVMLNKEGSADFESVLNKGKNAIAPNQFLSLANDEKAVVLDVRHQSDFAKAHIPNSIFIGIDGGFAPWVGTILRDVKQPILLVAASDRLEETIMRLARVGFDNIIGYLEGGIEAWITEKREVSTVTSISAEVFSERLKTSECSIYDVRKESEHASRSIIGSANTPLDKLKVYMPDFNTDELNYVHCAGGYRSMIACSILKANGIQNVVDIQGGFSAIENTDCELTDFVCPSTL